ncbi:hypothetical protein DFH09DRAFT_1077498 [Mycena vulgaris]|nr:hypothetical protein DFH09DRAFT_1077498 [Mycena vulgaris]
MPNVELFSVEQSLRQLHAVHHAFANLEDEWLEPNEIERLTDLLLPQEFLSNTVVCIKFFWMSDAEMREVDGDSPYNDREEITPLTPYMGRLAMAGYALRRHIGTQTTGLKIVNSEVERAEALKEFFGINIRQEDLKYTACANAIGAITWLIWRARTNGSTRQNMTSMASGAIGLAFWGGWSH